MLNNPISNIFIAFKNMLKKNPAIYFINEKFKSKQLKRDRQALFLKYEKLASLQKFVYTPDWARSSVQVRLRNRGVKTDRFVEKKPHVFWIGANLDQDNSGFLSSLSILADLSCSVKSNGEYGHTFPLDGNHAFQVDPKVIAENDVQLLQQVTKLHSQRPIDLVWGQMWANFVSPKTLIKIQTLGIPVINVAMDDRLPAHWASFKDYRLGSIGLKEGVDLVLTTSSECCAWYGAEGVPALFWPLASNPKHFQPAPEDEKLFDISFVGNRYGVRARIVDKLTNAGLSVAAFGGGWPRGYVDAAQISTIFAKSRIVLGIGTVGHSEDIFTLKLRDFDAPMSGALYITHRNPDLLLLYREGEEIECYTTIAECISKIHFYLQNPEERCRIAIAGRERALRDHTWDLRIKQAFSEVGIYV